MHVGDYAYDLQDGNGAWGDAFQASIEPITSSTPYMGCEGNHEGAMSFGHYSNRFAVFAGDNSSGTTPNIPGVVGGPNNHWYTYSVGPVFFAAMSTEAYFFYNGVQAQYEFLDAQLAAVDRSVTPWVIVYGHRSIYCSCDTDCDGAATTVRLGPKGDGVYGMETLFAKHKVDLFINGHEHDYERNYAVCVRRGPGSRGHFSDSPLTFARRLPAPPSPLPRRRLLLFAATRASSQRAPRAARQAAPPRRPRSSRTRARPFTSSRAAPATWSTTSPSRARSRRTAPSAPTRTATAA